MLYLLSFLMTDLFSSLIFKLLHASFSVVCFYRLCWLLILLIVYEGYTLAASFTCPKLIVLILVMVFPMLPFLIPTFDTMLIILGLDEARTHNIKEKLSWYVYQTIYESSHNPFTYKYTIHKGNKKWAETTITLY